MELMKGNMALMEGNMALTKGNNVLASRACKRVLHAQSRCNMP